MEHFQHEYLNMGRCVCNITDFDYTRTRNLIIGGLASQQLLACMDVAFHLVSLLEIKQGLH